MKNPTYLMPVKAVVSEESAVTNGNTNVELLPAEEKKEASVEVAQCVGIVRIPYETNAMDTVIRGVLDDIATTNPEKLKYVKRITWQQPYQIVILPPKIDFELN